MYCCKDVQHYNIYKYVWMYCLCHSHLQQLTVERQRGVSSKYAYLHKFKVKEFPCFQFHHSVWCKFCRVSWLTAPGITCKSYTSSHPLSWLYHVNFFLLPHIQNCWGKVRRLNFHNRTLRAMPAKSKTRKHLIGLAPLNITAAERIKFPKGIDPDKGWLHQFLFPPQS